MKRIVECAHCHKTFERFYKIGKARAKRPQFCSKKCLRDTHAERSKKTLPSRFWAFVEKRAENECWPWTGALLGFGYGNTSVAGKHILAHRLSYLMHYGSIPVGMCVLHRCDNPRCCNPSHLFVGTKLDNIDDMNAKGRGSKPPSRRGCDVNTNKLSEGQVREIYFAKGTNTAIARRYGVSRATIYGIKNGKSWRHFTASLCERPNHNGGLA